jgi:predicted transcriptional regulator
MDKIKTPQMLAAAFHKMRSEAGLRPSKIAERAGRSRDILDLLRATGHAIQIVPAGLPTMDQMRDMFKEDTDDTT